MSDIRERLKQRSVTAIAAQTSELGEVWFREPSGADWIRIKQLFAAFKAAGEAEVQSHLIVPLLMCREDGSLVYPDYAVGVAELQNLRGAALGELTEACLDVTGVGKLLRRGKENAEKNSSASPNSDLPSVSPSN